MSELDGFMPFDFDVGVASASITPNGITFNRSVATKLNYPENVVLLINANTKQIAIKVCKPDSPKAATFYKPKVEDEAARSVRWNNRDLLNNLSEMMGWDLKQMSHRVEGRLLPQENAMLFDLNKATDMK
ncbi:MAG: hypothetical protein K5663_06470 [Clostridiales bacterium]|nr:hypothetical protein [Clostridiales bacterium]